MTILLTKFSKDVFAFLLRFIERLMKEKKGFPLNQNKMLANSCSNEASFVK